MAAKVIQKRVPSDTDKKRSYRMSVYVNGKNELAVACTCRGFEETGNCKHMKRFNAERKKNEKK